MNQNHQCFIVRSEGGLGAQIVAASAYFFLKEIGCKGNVIYKPDFRNKIAKTWPKKIDDSFAKRDWKWNADYGLNETLKETFK